MLTYVKWDMATSSGRQSDMPTYYIQVVYFGHVEIQLVNGAFQFASVDIAMDQMSMYLCFPL